MRVWWVLAWSNYYPDGGLGNVYGTYATEQEAEDVAEELRTRGKPWSEDAEDDDMRIEVDNVEVVNIKDYLL